MEFLKKLVQWFESTHLQQQIADVDYQGLFTNPYFLVPVGIWAAFLIYKQKWKEIIIIAICIGVWWVSGTEYMNTLIIGEEIQIDKVLPVIFGGAIVLGFVVYLLFGRSD